GARGSVERCEGLERRGGPHCSCVGLAYGDCRPLDAVSVPALARGPCAVDLPGRDRLCRPGAEPRATWALRDPSVAGAKRVWRSLPGPARAGVGGLQVAITCVPRGEADQRIADVTRGDPDVPDRPPADAARACAGR